MKYNKNSHSTSKLYYLNRYYFYFNLKHTILFVAAVTIAKGEKRLNLFIYNILS